MPSYQTDEEEEKNDGMKLEIQTLHTENNRVGIQFDDNSAELTDKNLSCNKD